MGGNENETLNIELIYVFASKHGVIIMCFRGPVRNGLVPSESRMKLLNPSKAPLDDGIV